MEGIEAGKLSGGQVEFATGNLKARAPSEAHHAEDGRSGPEYGKQKPRDRQRRSDSGHGVQRRKCPAGPPKCHQWEKRACRCGPRTVRLASAGNGGRRERKGEDFSPVLSKAAK